MMNGTIACVGLKRSLYSVLGICGALLLAACDPSTQHTNNSSNGSEDYFEEPISERSKQYEPALQTSNKIVDLLKDGDLEKVYDFASPDFQKEFDKDTFTAMTTNMLASHGELIEFKPMQWAFTTVKRSGQEFLFSSKIVVHSSAQYFYHFRFDPNRDYQKIRGLHISIRQGQESVYASVAKLRRN